MQNFEEEVVGTYALRASRFSPAEADAALEQIMCILQRRPTDLDELRQNPLFLAIELASPLLASAIIESEGGSPDSIARLGAAVERYARRAGHRSTPFGLFAGIAAVSESATKEKIFHTPSGVERATMFDPGDRPLLTDIIYSNNVLQSFAGKAEVAEFALQPKHSEPKISRIGFTPVAETVWLFCRGGRSVQEVVEHLQSLRGPVSQEKCMQLVHALMLGQAVYRAPGRVSLKAFIGDPASPTRPASTMNLLVNVRLPDVAPRQDSLERRVGRIARKLFQMPIDGADAGHLESYGDKFSEKFGVGIRVPFRTATDARAGVGLINLLAPAPKRNSYSQTSAATKTLQSLKLKALRARTTTISIDDAGLDTLLDPARSKLQFDFDILYRPLSGQVARDTGADAWLAAMPGTPLPGQSFGRFTGMISDAAFRANLRPSNSWGEPVEPIQLWYLPRYVHSLDVMASPDMGTRHISIGFEDSSDKNQISLDDLELVHDGERLHLFSGDGQIPLVIRNMSMFNYPQLSAPIVHTLMTIGREHERDWASFGWGSESQSDHLPGVIFDGIGISKPVWRIPSAVADKTQPFEEWVASFEAWRDAHSLPDSMEFGAGDNLLSLHTRRKDDFAEIRRAISTESPAAFQAFDGDALFRDEELVHRSRSPLLPPSKVGAFANLLAYVEPAMAKEWITLELVSASSDEPAILDFVPLVSHAATLGATDWHFVRYNLPDQHIRLRFRAPTHETHQVMARDLTSFATDMIGTAVAGVRVTPYFPEYARYGGPENFDAVATAFTASSDAAIEFESRFVQSGDREKRLAAATESAIELLSNLLGPNWMQTSLDSLRNTRPPKQDHNLRSQVLRRMPNRSPDLAVRPTVALVGGNEPNRANSIAIVRSVLHMHANRFYGGNRDAEATLLSTIRSSILKTGQR